MAALSCRNISLIAPSVVSDARLVASRLVDVPRAPASRARARTSPSFAARRRTRSRRECDRTRARRTHEIASTLPASRDARAPFARCRHRARSCHGNGQSHRASRASGRSPGGPPFHVYRRVLPHQSSRHDTARHDTARHGTAVSSSWTRGVAGWVVMSHDSCVPPVHTHHTRENWREIRAASTNVSRRPRVTRRRS